MKHLLIIPAVFIAAIILTSCGSSESKGTKEAVEEKENEGTHGLVLLTKQQREAINLQLGRVEDRNMTNLIKTNGQLEVAPDNKADITAYVGGNVKEIKVFHGEKVVKGQTLALLEHPDYILLQEEFAQTASRLEFLKKEYDRQKALFENEVGAGKDFQQVKSEFNSVKAKYNGLKVRLEMLNINASAVESGTISRTVALKSPISGYVSLINTKVGSYVNSETKMFTISDNSAIHADFLVYEKDISRIKVGQKVQFTVANQPDKELTAKIFAIGKEFQQDTRAVLVHAKILDAPSNLTAELYISGTIYTDAVTTKALPEEAIAYEGAKSYIFVYDEKGTKMAALNHRDKEKNLQEADPWAFRIVEVVPGISNGKYVEVKFTVPLPENAKIAINTAYYLLADSKKETMSEH